MNRPGKNNKSKNAIVAYASREIWGVQDAAQQLANATGYSVRHMRRVFVGDVGVPEKVIDVLRDELAAKAARIEGLGTCI